MNNLVKNDLFDYPNRYIYQYEDGFKFSIDSILLAEFVVVKKTTKTILDMCTGNAPIPLIISTKTNKQIVGFEIQKEIYDLAIMSVKENKLENQINIINDDVKNIKKLFPGKYFDIITCNPPYFVLNNEIENNKNSIKSIARHEITINLEDIFEIVREILSDNGSFYLVHRMDRIDDIILYAEKYQLKVKELQIICTKENVCKIGLFKIQKHAKRGIKIRNIIDISKLNTYQNIFERREK